ncbi:MAG: radical SAM protein [Pseudomonadota bacterium]
MLDKANGGKFQNPLRTLDGSTRAHVGLKSLETLWFNTGTLCNIKCAHCYILSSPTNDALVYLSEQDVRPYLDEIRDRDLGTREIGLTGGEPFMNPHVIDIVGLSLRRGFEVLVLTNAMRPMMRPVMQKGLTRLVAEYGDRLTLRVSLDHYTAEHHDEERGKGSFELTLKGMRWLRDAGVRMSAAGRTLWGEDEDASRAGFADLFAREGFKIDADHPASLVLFPEMDENAEVPEITTDCWGILGKSPNDVMCANTRMVVRRRGADGPSVLACTLLAYDPRFELGSTLAEAGGAVSLNHPHCAKFCVLGGARCSA